MFQSQNQRIPSDTRTPAYPRSRSRVLHILQSVVALIAADDESARVRAEGVPSTIQYIFVPTRCPKGGKRPRLIFLTLVSTESKLKKVNNVRTYLHHVAAFRPSLVTRERRE